MKDKISVILPIYNVEKYLKKCVTAVLNQTYSNIEIILVDDGSTDKSPKLCDEFQKRDNRILVIHKKNGGLSDARNAGTRMASGKYITYIDSDDVVALDYIEYLYSLIKKYECSMSLCTHTVVCENGKKWSYGDGTEEVLDAEKCIYRMLYHDIIDTSAWGKMFQTDIAKEILYPKGKLFEDIGTVYRFFIRCKRIACGYQSKYYYMLRKNSIVSSEFNPRKLDLLEMTDMMAREVENVYPDLKDALIRRRVYARFSTLNQMLNVKGYAEEKKEIIDFIKLHQRNVLCNPKTPKRDKIAIYLLNVGYPVYKMCWEAKRFICGF